MGLQKRTSAALMLRKLKRPKLVSRPTQWVHMADQGGRMKRDAAEMTGTDDKGTASSDVENLTGTTAGSGSEAPKQPAKGAAPPDDTHRVHVDGA
jgi:hypothetical protein